MTQTHYLTAIKNDAAMDPLCVRILKFHYVEEVQHAKIDELIIDAVAATCSAGEIADAIAQYQDNCDRIDAVLAQQAEKDAEAVERLIGRSLISDERARFIETQDAASSWSFLGAGKEHKRVRATLDRLTSLT